MAVVKVLIKRRFKEGRAMEVFALLNKFRFDAMNQPGYISGETLIGHGDPQKLLVISVWQSMENWLSWKGDPNREANEAHLQPLLETQTEYEEYVLGTYPHKK